LHSPIYVQYLNICQHSALCVVAAVVVVAAAAAAAKTLSHTAENGEDALKSSPFLSLTGKSHFVLC